MSSTRSTGPTREDRRQKAQAALAAQRTADRRRRRLWLAGGSLLLVVVVFAALLIAKAAGGSRHGAAQPVALSAADTARVVESATGMPVPALDAIGRGTVSNPPLAVAGAPVLTSAGKPEVVYLGEEWCPYCAAQRWAIVVALSRFGSFSGLGVTQSASDDVFPGTRTFTFAKATYSSSYLAFTAVEIQDANRKPLQTPTAEQQRLIAVYDAPPYVPSESAGGIPFLDLGGKYVLSGASYSPQTLAGQSWTQIASALSDPSSADARGIGGSANALTAALCTLTGQQPAGVCSSKAVADAKGALK
jgi:thiol-disulfide isomerase/thioredoxin